MSKWVLNYKKHEHGITEFELFDTKQEALSHMDDYWYAELEYPDGQKLSSESKIKRITDKTIFFFKGIDWELVKIAAAGGIIGFLVYLYFSI